jgi:hypothetical protein
LVAAGETAERGGQRVARELFDHSASSCSRLRSSRRPRHFVMAMSNIRRLPLPKTPERAILRPTIIGNPGNVGFLAD